MTRSTRPSLADLWRASLAHLERQGAGDAPARARSLAIAALTTREVGEAGARVGAGCNVPDATRSRCRRMSRAST